MSHASTIRFNSGFGHENAFDGECARTLYHSEEEPAEQKPRDQEVAGSIALPAAPEKES
jgi:hypothetical protein